MTQSSSVSGAGNMLANRYASSLIDVAVQAGVLEAVQKDMMSLEASLAQSNELQSLVMSPVYGSAQQMSAVNDIVRAARFQQVTSNFLGVLVRNRRLSALQVIIRAFYAEMAKRSGEVEAYVRTAYPLSAEQEQRLAQTLANKTGKTVRLFVTVEPELLGGMVVTCGSQMIDDSLKTKLSRLKNAMISNSNQNASLKEVG